MAFLFRSSLSYQSIKSYLSAVRHLQIVSGYPDPSLSSLPRLSYALKGIQRGRPTSQRRTRLPITPELLIGIFQRWSAEPVTFDRVMLWAAFCLGFFGFMRAGEFTCPSLHSFSPDMLTPGDVAVDSHVSPSYITVHLKRSKNDPLGAGTTIHLGATGASLCPVLAMLAYLARRPCQPGPLFMFRDGLPLSRPKLVHRLREALNSTGVDDSGFSGHSFRIGAATAAARAGLSDSLIKTLGRWKSSAFSLYIRTPARQLAAASTALAAASTALAGTTLI